MKTNKKTKKTKKIIVYPNNPTTGRDIHFYEKGYATGKNWLDWRQKADDIDESVEEIRGWNKYGNNTKIDWCPVLLVVLILGVVIAILV